MSWSDDMRCLYCDGKLPLYRKITSGQFCSAAHSRAYWKEQERLAVERLSQTHDSLRAYRPPGAEAILGLPGTAPSSAVSNPFYLDGQQHPDDRQHSPGDGRHNPDDAVLEFARSESNRNQLVLAGFVRYAAPLACDWSSLPALFAAGPVSFTASAPEVLAASGATPIFLTGFSEDMPVAETIELSSSILPAVVQWSRRPVHPLTPAAADVSRSVEPGMTPEAPAVLRTPRLQDKHETEVPVAPVVAAVAIEKPALIEEPAVAAILADGPEPITLEPIAAEAVALEPVTAELVAAEPVTVEAAAAESVTEPIVEPILTEIAAEIVAEPASMAGLASLAMPAMLEHSLPVALPIPAQNLDAVATPPVFAKSALAVQGAPEPRMAGAVSLARLLGTESGAGMREISFSRATTTPLDAAVPGPVLVPLPKDMASPALGSAKMLALVAPRTSASAWAPAQSSVQAVDVAVASSAPQGVLPAAAELPFANMARFPLRSGGSVPARNEVAPVQAAVPAVELAELPLQCVSSTQEPAFAWLAKLPVNFAPVALEPARAFASQLSPVFPTGADPNPPRTQLEPADGSAVPPPPRSFLAFANWTPGDPSERRNAWEHVSDFWAHSPRDLKLLLFAIPVLLTLALHPHLPKVHVTAPTGTASAGLGKNFQQVFAQQMNTIQQNVASRAGVALAEDFRSGLEDWQTHGDLSAAWSFDANGFVRPGSLALYRPSMRLSDYDLQFLGLIDKKALSFVARAQDFENFYVIKLVVLKPGPLPTIGVTRYAVIHGKAQDRVDSIAPITATPDMLYHVDLTVHDDTFLLSLQGKVADSWSEPRLARGGVGFFAPRGEESRVRWVQLTHQYDMLGRLCAYLAPYNIPTTNGSF